MRPIVDSRARDAFPRPPRPPGQHPRGVGALALILALTSVVAAPGCAALSGARSSSTSPAAAAEAERTITDLRAKNAGYARRVSELENRVFILEDQLVARRAAEAAHTGPKPTVRIVQRREDSVVALSGALARDGAPPEAPRAPPPGQPEYAARAEDGGSSVLSDEQVEYGGDALSTGRRSAERRHRVTLRLRGSSRASAVEAELASSGGKTSKAGRLYRRSLAQLRAGKDTKALAGFRRFLAHYPRHERAADAQFWIGECRYDKSDLSGAETEYRRVIETYPQADKVPDAMLKLGVTLLAEGEADSGRKVLESLARRFPENEAGRSALARLDQKGDAGGPRAQPRVLGTVVTPAIAATAEPRRP